MFKVLDLFSGCGGLSEGFVQAGFDVSVSVEIDEKACETQRINHPETKVVQADLTRLTPEELVELTGEDEFDVIIGGPPCQGFSLIGTRLGTSKRFIDDPRNKLYKEFIRFVRYFQPPVVLMENVPGLFSFRGGRIKEAILEDFKESDPDQGYIGYNVDAKILNAAQFEVPQTRERVFFLAIREDFGILPSYPEPILDEEDFFTVRDAIGSLPPLGIRDGKHEVPFVWLENDYDRVLNGQARKLKRNNGYQEGHLYNHISRFHNERDRNIFRILKPFQKLKELDPELIPVRLRNGFDDFYRKIDWEKPSPTIIAHLYKDGLAFIHPDDEQARSISVREAARLQSFPDNFVFAGTQTAMFKQIGNAVPPLLAYHLANHIEEILSLITSSGKSLELKAK